MFTSKKNQIKKYLAKKSDGDKCAFDFFLSDYLQGTLKEQLMSMGIKKIEIFIDWYEDIKCIDIQGRYEMYYMNLQIFPQEFTISFDLVEPDEDVIYFLESKQQLYNILLDTIKTLH